MVRRLARSGLKRPSSSAPCTAFAFRQPMPRPRPTRFNREPFNVPGALPGAASPGGRRAGASRVAASPRASARHDAALQPMRRSSNNTMRGWGGPLPLLRPCRRRHPPPLPPAAAAADPSAPATSVFAACACGRQRAPEEEAGGQPGGQEGHLQGRSAAQGQLCPQRQPAGQQDFPPGVAQDSGGPQRGGAAHRGAASVSTRVGGWG